MPRIGLSPAFVISSSTPAFSAKDYLPAIRRAARMGFASLQLEVFRAEAVAEWSPGLRTDLRNLLELSGVVPSQFVAHFMLEDFRTATSLADGARNLAFRRFLEVAAAFPACPVVTIPIPPFEPGRAVGPGALGKARSALVDCLGGLLELTTAAGKRLALEVMPHSLVGGTEGFLRLREEAGLAALAYNFDTGHAWARKECLELIPALLGASLVGTHLCDNFGNESLKLRPGLGSIDFASLLAALEASGYQGTLDLEILCPPEAVEREYRAGLAFIEALVNPAWARLAPSAERN